MRRLVLAMIACAPCLRAQAPKFELASVKPSGPRTMMSVGPARSGDRVVWHGARIYSLIFYAYHLHGAYSLVNYEQGPLAYEDFDIDAETPAATSTDDLRLMFRALLQERFVLKVHPEKREITGYELALGKGKPKLADATEDQLMKVTIEDRPYSQAKGSCGTSLWKSGAHVVCHDATADQIAAEFGSLLKSPMVNRTELQGKYDLHITYLPEDRRLEADAPPGPSLEQAVQEELGLKLQKAKVAVDVLVVDHYERPSAN